MSEEKETTYPVYRVNPKCTACIDGWLQDANRVMDVGMNATPEQRAEAKAKELEILRKIAKVDPVFGERILGGRPATPLEE